MAERTENVTKNNDFAEKKIVKTYDYGDESGELLYQVVRYDPRDFRQRRPDANGDWIWNLQGVRRVPYRLQELLQANPADWVFIVEGEKDVDRLYDEGLVATTCAMGAGKWDDSYSEFLNDRKFVAIIPDNDEAGRRHAKQVAASLSRVGVKARILELPGLPEKGDVSDWFNEGGSKKELIKLAEAVTPFQTIDVSKFKPLSSQELLGILGLTIKKDEENKLITFLCELSAYTDSSQFNISFNAPSSTGKSYIPTETAVIGFQQEVCSHFLSSYDRPRDLRYFLVFFSPILEAFFFTVSVDRPNRAATLAVGLPGKSFLSKPTSLFDHRPLTIFFFAMAILL